MADPNLVLVEAFAEQRLDDKAVAQMLIRMATNGSLETAGLRECLKALYSIVMSQQETIKQLQAKVDKLTD